MFRGAFGIGLYHWLFPVGLLRKLFGGWLLLWSLLDGLSLCELSSGFLMRSGLGHRLTVGQLLA